MKINKMLSTLCVIQNKLKIQLICNLKEIHRAGSFSRSLIDPVHGMCSQGPTWSSQVSRLFLPVYHGPLCTDSLKAPPALLNLLVFLFVSASGYGICLIHPFIPSTQHSAWHAEVPKCLMKWSSADNLSQILCSLFGKSAKGLTRYSTLSIKKAKLSLSSSSIKTKGKSWLCLIDCFVFSCNGEVQGSKSTVLAAPGRPDTSVEHKGGGSVDPGSSRVPWETPALLAAGKERPRIAQTHPLAKTQKLPCTIGKVGCQQRGLVKLTWKSLPNPIKRTWFSSGIGRGWNSALLRGSEACLGFTQWVWWTCRKCINTKGTQRGPTAHEAQGPEALGGSQGGAAAGPLSGTAHCTRSSRGTGRSLETTVLEAIRATSQTSKRGGTNKETRGHEQNLRLSPGC